MRFTRIQNGLDVQRVAFVNEFVRAYSERRQAIGQSEVREIAAGTDIQSASFWRVMQEWMESNCTSFVDHTATIEGASAIPMHTLPSWRAAAGLSGGFRRTSGSGMARGVMQAGDIIGGWVFQDLQKGFDALRWTIRFAFVTPGSGQLKSSTGYGASNEEAVQNAVDQWPADWMDIPDEIPQIYSVGFSLQPTLCSLARLRAEATVNDIPTHVPHECSVYLDEGWDNFFDFDNLGFSAFSLNLVPNLSYPKGKIGSRTLQPLPYSDVPTIPPYPPVITGRYQRTLFCWVGAYFVLKWDFTHTLS
jgi:hypothetical protein